MTARRWFPVLAWAVLALNVGVVLGGAVVRATGSGDGCGASWPRCTGQIIPTNAGVETIIEFTHRATSGLAILGLIALVIVAFRAFPAGHIARMLALVSLGFMVVESLLGASLVLFEWVDQDESLGRLFVVPLHLTNTFLLLGSLALTAWWGSGNPPPQEGRSRRELGWLVTGAALIVAVGASGALNALADTLYPAESLSEGIRAEFGSDSPLLVRVRVIHPLLAIAAGLGVAVLATRLARGASERTERLAWIVGGLVFLQFFVGVANLALLTPLETQVLHLAMADVLWITFVLLAASLRGERVPASAPAEAVAP
jgi:heme A synthase